MFDPHTFGFRVETLRSSEQPQQLIWQAAHQCVSAHPTASDTPPPEDRAGQYVVKHLLAGHRGHYSPLEMPSITLACSGFPHSVIAQLTRHRLCAFAVQSQRYTSEGVIAVAKAAVPVESVFYWRPAGSYRDRDGKFYTRTVSDCVEDQATALESAARYTQRIERGFSEEEARGLLVQDLRQHFVIGMNLRALMHLLLVRGKKDSQLEIQLWAELALVEFRRWAPEIAAWFTDNLWQKGRLAP